MWRSVCNRKSEYADIAHKHIRVFKFRSNFCVDISSSVVFKVLGAYVHKLFIGRKLFLALLDYIRFLGKTAFVMQLIHIKSFCQPFADVPSVLGQQYTLYASHSCKIRYNTFGIRVELFLKCEASCIPFADSKIKNISALSLRVWDWYSLCVEQFTCSE